MSEGFTDGVMRLVEDVCDQLVTGSNIQQVLQVQLLETEEGQGLLAAILDNGGRLFAQVECPPEWLQFTEPTRQLERLTMDTLQRALDLANQSIEQATGGVTSGCMEGATVH